MPNSVESQPWLPSSQAWRVGEVVGGGTEGRRVRLAPAGKEVGSQVASAVGVELVGGAVGSAVGGEAVGDLVSRTQV